MDGVWEIEEKREKVERESSKRGRAARREEACESFTTYGPADS